MNCVAHRSAKEIHPISFCSCRKKPGGAWRQNGRAAFRRREDATSPYPLPRSSFPTANRCAGFAVGDRGLLAPFGSPQHSVRTDSFHSAAAYTRRLHIYSSVLPFKSEQVFGFDEEKRGNGCEAFRLAREAQRNTPVLTPIPQSA